MAVSAVNIRYDADQVIREYASKHLMDGREKIFQTPGLYTQGVSLMVLSPALWRSAVMPELVSQYRRVVFFVKPPDLSALSALFPAGEYTLHPDLTLIEGEADTVLPLSRGIAQSYVLPEGLELKTLQANDPDSLFSRLQSLQAGGGLESLATWFLRDCRLSRTIYLETDDGRIAGVSNIADLSSAGGDWREAAVVQRTTVSVDFQRLGLGTYLKAQVVLKAHREFASRRFIGTVRKANAASYRMNAACGLVASDSILAFGVEDFRLN